MDKNLKMILQKEKLENLLPLFTNQNITDSCLPDLDNDCLVDLGIEKMGDRKRLLHEFHFVSEQLATGGSFMITIVGGTLPDDSMLAGQKVDTFQIAKYPVMVAEWERVIIWGTAHGYEFKSAQALGSGALIVMLSWFDALKWSNAKSEQLGLTPCFSR